MGWLSLARNTKPCYTKYVLSFTYLKTVYMTKYTLSGAMMILLLLSGAGCAKQTTDTYKAPPSKPAVTTEQPNQPETVSETPKDDELMNDSGDGTDPVAGIDIDVVALGNQKVKLTWNVNQALAKQADGYRIIMSEQEDPEWPTQLWYQRNASVREHEWAGLPTGTHYFRICAWVDNRCTVYSSDFKLDVQ